MKNARFILLIAGLLYTVVTIILMMQEEALYNNLNLLNLLDYFKYWMVLGLIILVGLMVTGTLYTRSLEKQNQRLQQEHAATKATLYDIEQKRLEEDEQAGRRIEAFRQSLDKGNKPTGPDAPRA
jgi:hypothetical protein